MNVSLHGANKCSCDFSIGTTNQGQNPKRRKTVLASDDESTDSGEMGREDLKDCEIGEWTF